MLDWMLKLIAGLLAFAAFHWWAGVPFYDTLMIVILAEIAFEVYTVGEKTDALLQEYARLRKAFLDGTVISKNRLGDATSELADAREVESRNRWQKQAEDAGEVDDEGEQG